MICYLLGYPWNLRCASEDLSQLSVQRARKVPEPTSLAPSTMLSKSFEEHSHMISRLRVSHELASSSVSSFGSDDQTSGYIIDSPHQEKLVLFFA